MFTLFLSADTLRRTRKRAQELRSSPALTEIGGTLTPRCVSPTHIVPCRWACQADLVVPAHENCKQPNSLPSRQRPQAPGQALPLQTECRWCQGPDFRQWPHCCWQPHCRWQPRCCWLSGPPKQQLQPSWGRGWSLCGSAR